MITVIATVRAAPGKGPDLEADFRDYPAWVKANEPGTLMYTLSRSKDDTELYYALETYADEAAVATHMQNFQNRQGGAKDVAAGPPEILVLDRII